MNLTLDIDGTKVEYSFLMSGYVNASRQYGFAQARQLTAAVYREGEIRLEGKRRHVVLLDFNSNGRFDDQSRVRTDVHTPDGSVYPEQGDMLLVDANPDNPGIGRVRRHVGQ